MQETETNDRDRTLELRLATLETRLIEMEELVEVLDERVRDIEVYAQAGNDEGYEVIDPLGGDWP